MNAHLSFLPLSVSGPIASITTRPIPTHSGNPPCSEVTTHKRTSDPRYIARIVESGYPDGRRLRSTTVLEKLSGRVVDSLHLASSDHGQTWKVTHAGAGAAR